VIFEVSYHFTTFLFKRHQYFYLFHSLYNLVKALTTSWEEK
jgi:hypothetical protein